MNPTLDHALEDRFARLEAANRRLRWALASLVMAAVAIPLMSAMQSDAKVQDVATSANLAGKHIEADSITIKGADGWTLKLGAKDGERGGFGIHLMDKTGTSRARVVADGASPRIDVSSARGDHGAALVAENAKSSVCGLWKGKNWALRSEVKNGRPNALVYDDDGRMRLRYGMHKGNVYMTLVDPDGETDRAWMMLESTGRCSVAVRPEELAESALLGAKGEAVGVSVRDRAGKLRALMYTKAEDAHVATYGADETTRMDMRVKKNKASIEAVDAQGKATFQAPSK